MKEINEVTVRKVLETVDVGLVRGMGVPVPGHMCVEAAVCYALGLEHSDDPECVASSLRTLKIGLNDMFWSTPAARAKGLRRLAVAQLGSRDMMDSRVFKSMINKMVVQTLVHDAIMIVMESMERIKETKNESKDLNLRNVADQCKTHGLTEFAWAAHDALSLFPVKKYVHVLSSIARDVCYHASRECERDALFYFVELSCQNLRNMNINVPIKHADKIRADFAENVVQILIKLNVPGVKWLYLTEQYGV